MKREKTEYVLKKSLTSAYKPVVPNDIYKKNYSSKIFLYKHFCFVIIAKTSSYNFFLLIFLSQYRDAFVPTTFIQWTYAPGKNPHSACYQPSPEKLEKQYINVV